MSLPEDEVFPIADKLVGEGAHRGPHPGIGLHKGELRTAGIDEGHPATPLRA